MNISTDTWEKILKAIKEGKYTKKHLNLSGLMLGPIEIAMLVPALNSNRHICSLDLRWNPIEVSGAESLALTNHITDLQLDHNRIGDTGVIALMNNIHFTHLSLDFNQIEDNGAVAIAANKNLRKVRLNFNDIGDQGAAAFGLNTTLEELTLHKNLIKTTGTNALAANPKQSEPFPSPQPRPTPEMIKQNIENILGESESNLDPKPTILHRFTVNATTHFYNDTSYYTCTSTSMSIKPNPMIKKRKK